MDRRSFIRNSALISGSTLIAPGIMARTIPSVENNKENTLTILHTNDTHSNIDPFPENHAKYPGKGGVARRFNMIQRIRSEEENVLLLDAGDIFQGTPYFNKYGGVLEMKLMTELGYDAATMGNHDFDGGMDGFKNAKSYADFPFICSNYDFTNTILEGQTTDKFIIQKGQIKVGIFGLGVELEGLVPSTKFGETKYLDPVEIATDKVNELKAEKCDLILCLSHLGYSYSDQDRFSDLKLAEQTSGIHMIIGGHTHTFLDEPTQVVNSEGQTVLVNQVGWAGVNLGRVDFEFDKKGFTRKETIIVE